MWDFFKTSKMLTQMGFCAIMDNVVFKNLKEMNDKNKSNSPWWQSGLQLFLRLSSWIVGPIIIAIGIGKYLDKIFHTTPWLFLACVIGAFTLSITMIIRIGLKEMDKENKKL